MNAFRRWSRSNGASVLSSAIDICNVVDYLAGYKLARAQVNIAESPESGVAGLADKGVAALKPRESPMNDVVNEASAVVALGAVEVLQKPVSDDKLRNLRQHFVHKAFNARGKDVLAALKPVKESVVSMLHFQLENTEESEFVKEERNLETLLLNDNQLNGSIPDEVYVWNDLSENDVIYPFEGAEYILKASEVIADSSALGGRWKSPSEGVSHLNPTDGHILDASVEKKPRDGKYRLVIRLKKPSRILSKFKKKENPDGKSVKRKNAKYWDEDEWKGFKYRLFGFWEYSRGAKLTESQSHIQYNTNLIPDYESHVYQIIPLLECGHEWMAHGRKMKWDQAEYFRTMANEYKKVIADVEDIMEAETKDLLFEEKLYFNQKWKRCRIKTLHEALSQRLGKNVQLIMHEDDDKGDRYYLSEIQIILDENLERVDCEIPVSTANDRWDENSKWSYDHTIYKDEYTLI